MLSDPWAICDRCGFKYRLHTLRIEPRTHLKVCRECYDGTHPQDYVRGVPDRQTIPGARPRPADIEIPQTLFDENGVAILDENGNPVTDEGS